MSEAQSDEKAPPVERVLQSKAEIAAFYDKLARFYDLLSEHSERPMRERGLELLAVSPGETILEIGFGTGHCLVELVDAVGPEGEVVGIDLAQGMLDHARELLRQEKIADRVQLTRGDAAQLPYEDGSMDGIFTSFTLELFDTPEIPRVLAECLRVLRPGGRLVVVSLSKEGGPDPIRGVFEWSHRHFPNLLDCRPIYVRREIERAGFDIVEALREHMWVPVEIVCARKPE